MSGNWRTASLAAYADVSAAGPDQLEQPWHELYPPAGWTPQPVHVGCPRDLWRSTRAVVLLRRCPGCVAERNESRAA